MNAQKIIKLLATIWINKVNQFVEDNIIDTGRFGFNQILIKSNYLSVYTAASP